MTGHMIPVLGGEPVTARLRRDHADLIPRVLAELVANVPVYGRLPRELIEGDVRRVVDHALRLFRTSLETSTVEETDLGRLTDSAVLRAEEGVPMEMVLAAYYRGAQVAADSATSAARPDEVEDLRMLIGLLMSFMEKVTAAVAAGYAAHGRTAQAEQATARQLLVNALLAGEGFREAAGPADVELAPAYLVVALTVGAHPDEADPTVDRSVVTRRKLRRLREELDRHYRAPVLWVPANDGGLALVPDDDVRRLRSVLTEVERSAGAPVHAGVVTATPDTVAALVPQAREVLDVVRSLDRPSGVYQLADVALEFQLRQTSAARPLLAALLDPLDDQPELAHTLEVFLATGFNRRRTATRLEVHPNTVDNRLRKVTDLVGLDPTALSDLPRITAALAARS